MRAVLGDPAWSRKQSAGMTEDGKPLVTKNPSFRLLPCALLTWARPRAESF